MTYRSKVYTSADVQTEPMLCPVCGSELIPRKFVDTWDKDGKPLEVSTYPVCDICKVAWEPLDIKTMTAYEEILNDAGDL